MSVYTPLMVRGVISCLYAPPARVCVCVCVCGGGGGV